MYIPVEEIERLILSDLPLSDLTTEGLQLEGEGEIRCYFKLNNCVLAGVEVARRIFEQAGCQVEVLGQDGDRPQAEKVFMIVRGPAQKLHSCYKVAQCVMEYASGVASRVYKMLIQAREINPDIQIAGTRKHIPGTKMLAHIGFKAGGGIIHRANLSDSILIFDQHRVFCDDIDERIIRLVKSEPERKIAIEVETVQEAMHYASLGVSIIQFERMDPVKLDQAIKIMKKHYPNIVINAAGGINGINIQNFARTNVDVIVTSWPYYAMPCDVKMKFSVPSKGGNE